MFLYVLLFIKVQGICPPLDTGELLPREKAVEKVSATTGAKGVDGMENIVMAKAGRENGPRRLPAKGQLSQRQRQGIEGDRRQAEGKLSQRQRPSSSPTHTMATHKTEQA